MSYRPPLGGPGATGEQELGPGEASDIATDEIYATLADQNRRLILRYLQDAMGNAASRHQLAEHISERSSGPQNAEAVAIQLHHIHLPKLMDAGIVEYEAQAGSVQYTPLPTVETHLDYVDESDSR
ncbi:ArsR family transcriptional regulator [Natronoarchaeum mannanilyticum]|uniref:DUF7344 domain-containing protein n=1 Tax=Natronoarchaeum mannanilyticum TaxID=926360 RepID=A0AAV3TC30_9EURY